MPITNPAKRIAPRAGLRPLGPQVTGAAAVLAAFAALIVGAATLPREFVLPMMTLLLFILAALVALVASSPLRARDQAGLTYWDVAGLLTFIGVCAASQVDPDQIVRLVEVANREH